MEQAANMIAPVGMGRTASGIIAPVSAIDAHVSRSPVKASAQDADGRRRVVLTRDEQRKIQDVVDILARTGQVVIMACKPLNGTEGCGEALRREGEGDTDPGFGCRCTRIHFEPRPAPPARRRR